MKYELRAVRVRTWREVASSMNISIRRAQYLFYGAIRKLKKQPKAFEILLDAIQAVDASQDNILQAGSAECDKEFIFYNGEKE
jgi:hypothetical protein